MNIREQVPTLAHLSDEVRPYTNVAELARAAWGKWVTILAACFVNLVASKGLEVSASRAVPDWLSLNKEELKGVVMRIPTRDEIQPIANEQAVVEFYSR